MPITPARRCLVWFALAMLPALSLACADESLPPVGMIDLTDTGGPMTTTGTPAGGQSSSPSSAGSALIGAWHLAFETGGYEIIFAQGNVGLGAQWSTTETTNGRVKVQRDTFTWTVDGDVVNMVRDKSPGSCMSGAMPYGTFTFVITGNELSLQAPNVRMRVVKGQGRASTAKDIIPGCWVKGSFVANAAATEPDSSTDPYATKPELALQPYDDGEFSLAKPAEWVGGAKLELGDGVERRYAFVAPETGRWNGRFDLETRLMRREVTDWPRADAILDPLVSSHRLVSRRGDGRDAVATIDTGSNDTGRIVSVGVRVLHVEGGLFRIVVVTLARASIEAYSDHHATLLLRAALYGFRAKSDMDPRALVGVWEAFKGRPINYQSGGTWVASGQEGTYQKFQFHSDGTYSLLTVYSTTKGVLGFSGLSSAEEVGRYQTNGSTLTLVRSRCRSRSETMGSHNAVKDGVCLEGVTPLALTVWPGNNPDSFELHGLSLEPIGGDRARSALMKRVK